MQSVAFGIFKYSITFVFGNTPKVFLNTPKVFLNTPKVILNKAGLLSNKAGLLSNKAGLLSNKARLFQNKAGLLSNRHFMVSIYSIFGLQRPKISSKSHKIHQFSMCFTRCFCYFSPKTGICCHSAATKNMPKYWHYRSLVAGWQQNLKNIFQSISHILIPNWHIKE